MHVRKNIPLVSVGIILAISWSRLLAAESLDQAWAIALAADGRLEATHLQVDAARWQNTAAHRARLPSLNNTTTYFVLSETPTGNIPVPIAGIAPLMTPLSDRSFALSSTTASVPLYMGGRIRAQENATAHQMNLQRETAAQTALDVKIVVTTAYIDVLRSWRAVEVAEGNIRSLKEHVRVVQAKRREGSVAPNDLLAAEVTLSDASQIWIRAVANRDNAHAYYNRVLHRDPFAPVAIEEITAPHYEGEPETLIAMAFTLRPELAQLDSQAEVLRAKSVMETAATRPQIGLTGGFVYFQNQNITPNDYWVSSLGMTWSPYDGGVSSARSKAMLQEANAINSLRRDMASQIALEVNQAWLHVQESQKRVELAEHAIRQADENLRVAQERYIVGCGSNTDVLAAEALRTRNLASYYGGIYDVVHAVFRLRRSIGDL